MPFHTLVLTAVKAARCVSAARGRGVISELICSQFTAVVTSGHLLSTCHVESIAVASARDEGSRPWPGAVKTQLLINAASSFKSHLFPQKIKANKFFHPE